MIYDIGEILKDCIAAENLPYVDVLAGVVQTETSTKLGKNKGEYIQKSFPIYCPLKEDCGNKIMPLVPDNKLRSLFYFERNGDVLYTGRDRNSSQFTGDLLLTVWLNPKALGVDDCSISAPIVANLIQILKKNIFNGPNGIYSRILIKPISVKSKETSIFSKYKYSNKFYHLLEYPYDYFQIRIQVDFSVGDSCMPEFIPQPPITC